MRRKLSFALCALLIVTAVPVLAPQTTASTDLAVDEFVFAGLVTTELVTAVKCPVATKTCSEENADCGVEANRCHCKAGGGTLTCVKNPGGGGPEI